MNAYVCRVAGLLSFSIFYPILLALAAKSCHLMHNDHRTLAYISAFATGLVAVTSIFWAAAVWGHFETIAHKSERGVS